MHDYQPPPNLEKVESRFSNAIPFVDPFGPKKPFPSNLWDAILSTTLYRTYHIITFFTLWATLVTLINHHKIYALNFQATLLTVVGTVIGFIISYRTTSSFERYNEGRKLWSQIILNSRTFARSTWFHVPDVPVPCPYGEGLTDEEIRARSLVEKKSVVNLVEAFGVSVKHYLRGEGGCYYEDLYPLIKYLPAYALPFGLPSPGNSVAEGQSVAHDMEATLTSPRERKHSAADLPLPAVATKKAQSPLRPPGSSMTHDAGRPQYDSLAPPIPFRRSQAPAEEPNLLPSRMPPSFSFFDVFPLSLFVRLLTQKGNVVKGRKAARLRARLGRGVRGQIVSHNVPLEITLYLSSYVAALQRRKYIDIATTNLLLGSLNGLVDALTGLERILTTPIPFSYSTHLWAVTTLYCLALPLQIWKTMGWLTIPSTAILVFIFFGFITAGEEIENPFGYDKNDLNMDHFTHSIIRPELMAITSLPTPEPLDWAFSPLNDLLFDPHYLTTDKTARKVVERATPDEWVARGLTRIRNVLASGVDRYQA